MEAKLLRLYKSYSVSLILLGVWTFLLVGYYVFDAVDYNYLRLVGGAYLGWVSMGWFLRYRDRKRL